MTKPAQPTGAQARLLRVKLPRVQIDGERPALGVDRAEPLAREGIGIQAKVAAAADWQRVAIAPVHRQRELPNLSCPPDDPVGRQRRAGHAVTVVVRRIDAGVEEKAFFTENVECPKTLLRDREARSAIGSDRLADDFLNHVLRLPQIVAKLVRFLPIDELVPIAVAADLVTGPVTGSHQVRWPLRHPAEEVEGRPHAGGREDVENLLRAWNDA